MEIHCFNRWLDLRGACIAAMLLSTPLLPAAETPPPIEWQASFGGTGGDNFSRVVSAGDGGFVCLGVSTSGVSGNKTSGNYGAFDLWLVKIDAMGNKVWDKSFGGSDDDAFYSAALAATPDGGFLFGGDSWSGISGNKTSVNYGGGDMWLVKVDAAGTKLWDKSFGSSEADVLFTVVSTDDGGALLGGLSNSGVSGNKTSANYGAFDLWLVKVDASGNKLWDKSFGGSGDDGHLNDFYPFVSIVPSGDGGYLIGGPSASGISGNKTSPNLGNFDYWLIKIDSSGNTLWDRTFGGDRGDFLTGIAPTPDGGFVLGGFSESGVSGTKTSAAYGMKDYWVVKVDAAGNKLWDKTFGTSVAEEDLRSIAVTADGEILLGGFRACFPCADLDYWLVKLDAAGTMLWEQFFGASYTGATGVDILSTVLSTEDGGILLGGLSSSGISGNKTSPDYGSWDAWVIKLVGPPKLFIAQTSDEIRISWPLFAADYVLEQSEQLESASAWVPVAPPFQSDPTGYFFSVPEPAARQFFRLRKP